jgi:hypothetical protein
MREQTADGSGIAIPTSAERALLEPPVFTSLSAPFLGAIFCDSIPKTVRISSLSVNSRFSPTLDSLRLETAFF